MAQNNVLIVQEGTVASVPEASFDGGMITFTFQKEAQVIYEVGLMNIEEGNASISVTYNGNQVRDIAVTGSGRNSVQKVPINLERVSSLKVTLTGPGAVTSIYGCYEPGPESPTQAPSFEGSPLPTSPPAPSTGAPPTGGAPTVGPPTAGPAPTPGGGTPPGPTGPPVEGCVEATVTFDTAGNGNELPGGLYVVDEWEDAYGFTLSAMDGSSNVFPRLFDTSDFGQGTSTNFALGSPNNRCSPPGPGRGLFGQVRYETLWQCMFQG